jgi:PKD repeat protein
MTGRKGNKVTVTVLEDGEPIETYYLHRETGNNNGERITFRLKVKVGSSYSLKFNYYGGKGSNPVIVYFGLEDENKPLTLNFNSKKESERTKTVNIDNYLDDTLAGNRLYHFDASLSYDPDGSIESYDWEFGDGKIGSGKVTSHEYAQSGVYMVVLTVTDNQGLQGTKERFLSVS